MNETKIPFNRLNDVYVKALLGDENKKNLTLDFINSTLERTGDRAFTDLQFINKEQEPPFEHGKVTILDILAEMNDGSKVDIEIQVARHDFLKERSLYYWARMYASELHQGDAYRFLKPTISIVLLGFNGAFKSPDYHHAYVIQDIKTHERLTEQLEMHFVELEKVRISDIKKVKRKDTWFLYFSPKCTEAERKELAMKNNAIKKAIDYEDLFHGNKNLWYAYEQNEKAIRDYNSLMDTSRREGEAVGERRGREKGRIEGAAEKSAKIALSLLRDKMPLAKIAQWTNLPEEEIRQIAKKHGLEI